MRINTLSHFSFASTGFEEKKNLFESSETIKNNYKKKEEQERQSVILAVYIQWEK